jgi:ADP-heptose:LPS heptosyltransferase
MTTAPPADRILVIRLGALGDVMRSFPAVAELRDLHPRAHITWLVEPPSASAVASHFAIDEILVFPRDVLEAHLRASRMAALLRSAAAFVRSLRRRRFDLVVDLHSILKSGLLSRLSGAPVRVGFGRPFGRELSWLFANRRVQLEDRRISRFERNAAMIDYLAARAHEPRTKKAREPLIRPDGDAVVRMRSMLGSDGRICVIHPGTSRGTAYKRYTASGYASLARALVADHGVRCVVTAGSDGEERALAESVVRASAGSASLAPATPTFADLAALIASSDLFVGSDSGPLHLASLCGTPVVQIMGPTDPVENAPFPGTASRRVRVPVPCSPCRRGCAAAPCMREIPPERVIAAAGELLDEAASVMSSGTSH